MRRSQKKIVTISKKKEKRKETKNKKQANIIMSSRKALEKAQKFIPAEVHMISGCQDAQTSSDVSDVTNFQLPDPCGKAGGALTATLLSVTYADHEDTGKDLSFQETLLRVRDKLKEKNFEQVPQLSSSRPMDVKKTFDLVPRGCRGTRRAVMIGINYTGTDGELSGCHNDVGNMKDYIMDVHGFKEKNITLLLDDGRHKSPTKDNIMKAYKKLVKDSKPGDVIFTHFSGHGAKMKDLDGDEDDGYDESIVPLDYGEEGVILDDDLLKEFIMPLKEGVFATCIFDCCHSGTVLDLPYIFVAGQDDKMTLDSHYDFDHAQNAMQTMANKLSNMFTRKDSRKKSGFEVELRDDGMYYLIAIPKSCHSLCVGDRVMAINGIKCRDIEDEKTANDLFDTVNLGFED